MSKIRIATRGSQMALVQARDVETRLKQAHAHLETEIVIIKTSGDWKPGEGEKRLSEAQGGKGLFAKEIEAALLAGEADIGVHSVKDMPSFLPEGLAMEHYLERHDCRDAFVSPHYKSLFEMPAGSVVGTASVRRQAFILLKRPDLKVVPFRGNVPTRIEKMQQGQVDATLLSYAGMKRINIAHLAGAVFEVNEMVPACGQGVVGIECRKNDPQVKKYLSAIHHAETGLCMEAERAALQVLDGSCQAPIGVYAQLNNDNLSIHLFVARPDGTEFWEAREHVACRTPEEARRIGENIAFAIKGRVEPCVLAHS